MRTLITTQAKLADSSLASVKSHLEAAETEGFWLDISAPDEEVYQLLLDLFGFHFRRHGWI